MIDINFNPSRKDLRIFSLGLLVFLALVGWVVERRTGRVELCYALEAPVWDRFGSFAGQPEIAGTVVRTTGHRRVVIEGRRREALRRGRVTSATAERTGSKAQARNPLPMHARAAV